jgi:putative SOS response-associated peptidase YedK
MCNLFENTVSFADLVRAFANHGRPVLKPEPQAAPNLPLFEAVRPTDFAPIVRPFGEGCELVQLRWGFIADRPKAGPVTNFRSEGRRFGNAEDRGRCLVPATAFYEFTGNASPQTSSRKTRWRFAEAGQPWFCLAGLWRRHPEAGERFTLLTTEPGPDMAPYHNRQVVLLPRERWADWLSGAPEADLLAPSPAGTLKVAKDSPEPAPSPSLPLFGGHP